MKYGIMRANGTVKMADENTGLPVVTSAPPEIEEGYFAYSHFEEQDGKLVQVWETRELTAEEIEKMNADEGGVTE